VLTGAFSFVDDYWCEAASIAIDDDDFWRYLTLVS